LCLNLPQGDHRALLRSLDADAFLCLSKIKSGCIDGAARRELGDNESARLVRRHAKVSRSSGRISAPFSGAIALNGFLFSDRFRCSFDKQDRTHSRSLSVTSDNARELHWFKTLDHQ
jgi:hypothetical protein